MVLGLVFDCAGVVISTGLIFRGRPRFLGTVAGVAGVDSEREEDVLTVVLAAAFLGLCDLRGRPRFFGIVRAAAAIALESKGCDCE